MACNPCNPCIEAGCLDSPPLACLITGAYLPCVNLPAGTTLDVVLAAIDAKLCALSPSPPVPTCGTWTNIVLINGAAVGVIRFVDGLTSIGFSSTPQYIIDGCGTVRLRGFVRQSVVFATAGTLVGFTTMFDSIVPAGAFSTLPLGFRPGRFTATPIVGTVTEVLPTPAVLDYIPNSHIVKFTLFVNTTGDMFIGVSGNIGFSDGTYRLDFSLDNVEFSIN